jgi:hypothetical protein
MTMTEQDGPPRPVLPTNGTGEPAERDVVPRPFCTAIVYDDEGRRRVCPWRSAMTWHGIPFCASHAPRRTPGLGGWSLL